MFDIGGSELLVVLVVAIVVVGPKDLPKLMRAAGQWAGRARAMADQFRRSFDDMARQAELEEMRAEVMKLHNEKSLAEIQRETDIMLGYLPPDPVHTIDPNHSLVDQTETPAPDAPASSEGAERPALSEASAEAPEPPPAETPLPPTRDRV